MLTAAEIIVAAVFGPVALVEFSALAVPIIATAATRIAAFELAATTIVVPVLAVLVAAIVLTLAVTVLAVSVATAALTSVIAMLEQIVAALGLGVAHAGAAFRTVAVLLHGLLAGLVAVLALRLAFGNKLATFVLAYAVPSPFWARVLPQVKAAHPYSWIFGEVIHGDYPRIIEESTMDSITQYELWKSIQHALETENFFELDWNLKRHNAFLNSFVPQTFIGNHDVTRIASQIGPAKAALALAVLMTVGGVPSIYYGDEQGYVGVKQERFGGDDDVRPKFPDSPAELSTLGEPTYRLHQALIALRRRNPWLMDARTEAVKLENKHFVYRSTSADAQHSLTVDLNIEQSPTFTIRNADGSTAYQY